MWAPREHGYLKLEVCMHNQLPSISTSLHIATYHNKLIVHVYAIMCICVYSYTHTRTHAHAHKHTLKYIIKLYMCVHISIYVCIYSIHTHWCLTAGYMCT